MSHNTILTLYIFTRNKDVDALIGGQRMPELANYIPIRHHVGL
jgi:hypothetical protein